MAASNLLSLAFLTLLAAAAAAALPEFPPTKTSNPNLINSNSVLVALLDSHYTELSELVEKALLLQTLEEAVSRHNISIFAPRNDALRRDIDPEFRRFLLEPGNLKSLQNLLLFHIVPARIEPEHWRNKPTYHATLTSEKIPLHRKMVVKPSDISRPDGIIHGIEKLLIPKSVQHEFNARRSLSATAAVLPTAAPVVDPRTNRLKKPAPAVPAGSPPPLPISYALSPGPSISPAPAPGPGGPRHHFDGESQVKDFIQTLLRYGGYSEVADILVNLTSLATEIGKLVSEGYVITVLAPGDEAMAKLTADRLSEPGAPEEIMYYHLIPEYQTEESMYNTVRRFGTVNYETLRVPRKVSAKESDGSVMFGSGDGSGNLVDPDIYTDGRISVQGIDGVLLPPEESSSKAPPVAKIVSKPRRGKLLEMACTMLGAVGQDSRFSNCH